MNGRLGGGNGPLSSGLGDMQMSGAVCTPGNCFTDGSLLLRMCMAAVTVLPYRDRKPPFVITEPSAAYDSPQPLTVQTLLWSRNSMYNSSHCL